MAVSNVSIETSSPGGGFRLSENRNCLQRVPLATASASLRASISRSQENPAQLTSSLLAKVKQDGKPAGETEARVAEVSRILAVLSAKEPRAYHQARVLGGLVGEAFETVRANPDSLRKAVRRALDALISAGQVEADGSGGYRAANSADPQPEPLVNVLH